ncbi:hypothetical protein ANN_05362 [Periplaneta americana]|uniref:Uncharacterized protein n=1 Tax=Periplaneta americana TaxID=6978 RepID=A0ABQ8TD13_PERAM|nr:hypothetical protein ANN_05362 [Periplaneta americana]
MAGLCEGGNEPSGSLKKPAQLHSRVISRWHATRGDLVALLITSDGRRSRRKQLTRYTAPRISHRAPLILIDVKFIVNCIQIKTFILTFLSFEEVEKFKYLGATVTNINDILFQ